jgi:hypothetical protein
MVAPNWKPSPKKLLAYEGVYLLNRCFEAALFSLERLEGLELFRGNHLNEYEVVLQHTRAEANEELTDALHDYELEDSARFDQVRRDWEKQRKDPNDVFFEAHDRKREIKEQIKELERALERQHSKPKKRKSG